MLLYKDDLAQMGPDYFASLDHQTLVKVACRLHETAVELLERVHQNSQNTSRPPSSDDPFVKPRIQEGSKTSGGDIDIPSGKNMRSDSKSKRAEPDQRRHAGKQPGAPGVWRSEPLKAEQVIPHYPDHCAACGAGLSASDSGKAYMGHYVLDLEKTDSGFRVFCSLHRFYSIKCNCCGHETKARPGEGYVSCIDGRKRDLKLQEYILVGPMLATFIASLSVRYRLSRRKIQEFLWDWAGTSLSIGTIDRCIREVGTACIPVVDKLIEELQGAEILHVDETPWYEAGHFLWLWVVITSNIAVYHIGSRKKEEFFNLVTDLFVGWLITDGYGVYRSYKNRQRCLAHLIRKAIGLAEGVYEKGQRFGAWVLRELRSLIKTMSEGGEDARLDCNPILARLKRACLLGKDGPIKKMRALAREILNDWDAVVAFVKNPELPPTNNEAERALRHAVIARRISYGTRTPEGSKAYSALLSVIETCRLRGINPWPYISEVIALARKGIAPPPIPTPRCCEQEGM